MNVPANLQTSRVLPSYNKPKVGSVVVATSRDDSQSGTDHHKALLVDDNVDLLDLAAVLFRQLGFVVYAAVSGDEALDVLASTPDFDVLFTDVVMPGISGIQLGHAARKLYPDLNIILVSGYPQAAIAAGHGDVHDFNFLNKPYRLAEIVKCLKNPH